MWALVTDGLRHGRPLLKVVVVAHNLRVRARHAAPDICIGVSGCHSKHRCLQFGPTATDRRSETEVTRAGRAAPHFIRS